MPTLYREALLKWLETEGKTVSGSILHVGSRIDRFKYKRFLPNISSYLNLDIRPFHNVDIVADVQNMPIVATCSVDCILAFFMLYLVPNVDKAFREFKRVLTPHGVLLCSFTGLGWKRKLGQVKGLHRWTKQEAINQVARHFTITKIHEHYEDGRYVATFIRVSAH